MAALISCASKQIQIMNKLLQTEEKKIREKDKKNIFTIFYRYLTVAYYR